MNTSPLILARRLIWVVLSVSFAVGCQATHPAQKTASPHAATPSASRTKTLIAAADKCRARKPLRRHHRPHDHPGQQAVAQRLGGGWIWNATTKTCMTSTKFVISTGPAGAGFCTEAALAASNPGYNADATPSRPLKKVIASKGGSC